MQKFWRILRGLWVLLNALLALALLVSVLAVQISPADFWLPGLFGLLSPIWIVGNAAFLLYWIIRWKRWVWISALALFVALPQIVGFFRINLNSSAVEARPDFRVLSYNVNLFHLYRWSPTAPTYDSIVALLDRAKADIICLQEYYNNSEFTRREALRRIDSIAHIHYIVHGHGGQYGIATFSKYPIVDSGVLTFANTANATIFTDLKIGSDTVRVYNNHLQSFRFNSATLAFIRNPSLRGERRPVAQVTELLQTIRQALVKRALQVQQVRRHIAKSPYPVIVCGDFNDSPVSYTYHAMRGETLEDAFLRVGSGFGTTYTNLVPAFRIDYMLYSSQLEPTDFMVLTSLYSDHYPILVPFRFQRVQASSPAAPNAQEQ